MSMEFYEILAQSPSAERTGLLLELIENHPEGRLQLPAREGGRAALEGVDLSRARSSRALWRLRSAQLVGRRTARHRPPPCGPARGEPARSEPGGGHARGGGSPGADLAGATWKAPCWTGRTSPVRSSKTPTSVGAPALRPDGGPGAGRLQTRRRRPVGADLKGADLDRTDLQKANLTEADVSGADIRESDLRGANLSRANFRNALLNGSDLQTALFKGTDLGGAVLREAKLQGATLTDCKLTHAHFADAWLDRTRLLRDQLGDSIGEELAGEYELARRGYLTLERNFDETGETDASSWAYRKKRRMQKLEDWRRGRTAQGKHEYLAASKFYLGYGSHLLTECVCDYGESIWRVLFTMAAIFVLFATLYAALGSVVREHPGAARDVTRRTTDLSLYSLTAMISPGNPPEGLFPADDGAQLLTGVQSFLGVFLIGLLGFVAGNRIRR